MKIKVVYKSLDEGDYTAHSPIFPNCIGRGENRGDALIDLGSKIKHYIEEVEKKLCADKNANINVHDLSDL